MFVRRSSVIAILVMLGFVLPAQAGMADRLSDLQTRFDRETNSVRKAKLFERIGDEQFSNARQASQNKDYKSVAEIMESYRNNARSAFSALKKEHPNAEKQLSGYKQLQIHIHKGIREVDESLLVVSEDFQPPLTLVRRDLASMDDELLVLIFPRRPDEKKPNGSSPPPSSPGLTKALPNSTAPPAADAKPPDRPNEPATVGADPNVGSSGNTETQDQPETPPEEKPVEKSEMPDMDIKNCLVVAVMTCSLGANCGGTPFQPQQKDYLSPLESDKIRDAETTNERIKLFLTFADDRLKKFQYELQHPSSNRHTEMLNGLMNGYAGCVDDAADLMQLGVEKQENVRAGIDMMATKTKEFLDVLNKLAEEKVELDVYRDNLNDAIEGTRDAMNDAEKAKKSVAPPPVRRKG